MLDPAGPGIELREFAVAAPAHLQALVEHEHRRAGRTLIDRDHVTHDSSPGWWAAWRPMNSITSVATTSRSTSTAIKWKLRSRMRTRSACARSAIRAAHATGAV